MFSACLVFMDTWETKAHSEFVFGHGRTHFPFWWPAAWAGTGELLAMVFRQ